MVAGFFLWLASILSIAGSGVILFSDRLECRRQPPWIGLYFLSRPWSGCCRLVFIQKDSPSNFFTGFITGLLVCKPGVSLCRAATLSGFAGDIRGCFRTLCNQLGSSLYSIRGHAQNQVHGRGDHRSQYYLLLNKPAVFFRRYRWETAFDDLNHDSVGGGMVLPNLVSYRQNKNTSSKELPSGSGSPAFFLGFGSIYQRRLDVQYYFSVLRFLRVNLQGLSDIAVHGCTGCRVIFTTPVE